eukprot:SAG31_NODE_5047_length_2778_cov_3.375887_1_plen_179_part_00
MHRSIRATCLRARADLISAQRAGSISRVPQSQHSLSTVSARSLLTWSAADAATPAKNTAAGHWVMLQLSDSSLPTGGFAHSAGLEAAWQQGVISGRNSLETFLRSSLDQASSVGLPHVSAGHDLAVRAAKSPSTEGAERLIEGWSVLDNQLHAIARANHVACRASTVLSFPKSFPICN